MTELDATQDESLPTDTAPADHHDMAADDTPDQGYSSVWHIHRDLAGYLAEAAVADHLSRENDDTIWVGGNRQAVDVYSGFPEHATTYEAQRTRENQRAASVRVDAKHSYVNEYLLDGARQEVVSFFGSAREVQAREDVTHYALVVFHLDDDDVRENRVLVAKDGTVSVNTSFRTKRLYMVPAEIVNELFRRKENTKGDPTGLEQCAPVKALAAYLVAGTDFNVQD